MKSGGSFNFTDLHKNPITVRSPNIQQVECDEEKIYRKLSW